MGHIAHLRNQFKSMNTFEERYDYIYPNSIFLAFNIYPNAIAMEEIFVHFLMKGISR